MTKIRQYIVLIANLLFAFSVTVTAQEQVTAKLDSSAIYIGQRIGMTLTVNTDKGKIVELPVLDSLQEVSSGVEYVCSSEPDTSFMDGGNRVCISKRYFFTAFDSALYLIPPMQVQVDDKVYETQKLAFKVVTMDVDTANIERFTPNKPELAPPFEWAEWREVIIYGVMCLIAIALLVYVIWRLRNNKPILRRVRNKQKLAPHKVAMQKIEVIKEEKIWQSDDSKEYYTKLTDTLREYIKERYGFNATEMTSFEIIQHLESVNDDEAISELRELFQTADLVKFAKYTTLINENDRNLVSAIEYINQTKQELPEQQPQPEVVIVQDHHSKIMSRWLIASIVLVSLIILGVLGYIGYRIYMLTL